METSLQHSSVAEFYDGKTIFITGVTGFVGKVLVEKLLRSCPKLKTIYVLLRQKQGMSPSARLDHIFSCQMFDYLKNNKPSSIGKVVPIIGDIAQPNLGLSPSQRDLLINHVELVFHCAATVKFNEPLKEAVHVNVLGTKRLLELCKEMKKLITVVYISTAYANSIRHGEVVDEIVYPPPAPVEKFIETVEWMDDDILTTITPNVLRDYPNTYTFTKALAENLTIEESENIPFAIVRPSIITAAWREPVPGWVDNPNGVTGTMIGVGKGVVRSLYGRDVIADIIPVDVVANLTIVAGWHTATNRERTVKVYHCTSSATNPIRWSQIASYSVEVTRKYPFLNPYRHPRFSFRSSMIHHKLVLLTDHWLPAIITDLAALVLGKKPRMLNIYDKLHRTSQTLEYFTSHEWIFSNKNISTLLEEMSEEDRKTFYFDVSSLHWSTYWEDYVLGSRQHLLKEEHKTLVLARKQGERLLRWQRIMNIATVLLGIIILLRKFKPLRKLSMSLIFAMLRLLLNFMLLITL